jgi:hypothetical protein
VSILPRPCPVQTDQEAPTQYKIILFEVECEYSSFPDKMIVTQLDWDKASKVELLSCSLIPIRRNPDKWDEMLNQRKRNMNVLCTSITSTLSLRLFQNKNFKKFKP